MNSGAPEGWVAHCSTSVTFSENIGISWTDKNISSPVSFALLLIKYFLLFSSGPWWSWSHSSWIYNYQCNQCLSPLSSNPTHGEVYSLQLYVIKFVSNLRHVGCFPRVLSFPSPNRTEILPLSTIITYCFPDKNRKSLMLNTKSRWIVS